jgi:hypothetical protein
MWWAFEEPTVTGDTFLAVMENTALRYAPVGTVFQLGGTSPHFSHRVRAFLDRECHDRWIGRGGPISWPPSFSLFHFSGFILLEVCKRRFVAKQKNKM